MKDPQLWQKFVYNFDNIIKSYPDYLNRANLILSSLTSGCNVLVFSPVGFPLDLYLKFVATLKYSTFTKKECIYDRHVVYHETPHFIEIDFSHPSNRKVMDHVQSLIMTIVQTSCIHDTFHLIICKHVDLIDDPHSFRVILERFNKNAKFLCTTTSLSKLEAPIKSRFFTIRVPLFTCQQIQEIMSQIGGQLDKMQCRNIIKCIGLSDLHNNGHDISLVATYVYPPVRDFMVNKNYTILSIREFSNKVCSHGVPLPLFVQDLLMHVPESKKRSFIQYAAELEHMLVQTNGGRQPLYYELLMYIAIYGKPNTSNNK